MREILLFVALGSSLFLACCKDRNSSLNKDKTERGIKSGPPEEVGHFNRTPGEEVDDLPEETMFQRIDRSSQDIAALKDLFKTISLDEKLLPEDKNEYLESLLIKIAFLNTNEFQILLRQLDPGEYTESALRNIFDNLTRTSKFAPGELTRWVLNLETVKFKSAASEGIIGGLIDLNRSEDISFPQFLSELDGLNITPRNYARIIESSGGFEDYGRYEQLESELNLSSQELLEFRQHVFNKAPNEISFRILQNVDDETMLSSDVTKEFYVSRTRTIVSSFVSSQPAENLTYIRRLEDFPLKEEAFKTGVNRWLNQDPMRAGEWIGEMEASKDRDIAVEALVIHCIGEGAIEDAQEWLGEISSEERRLSLQDQIAQSE